MSSDFGPFVTNLESWVTWGAPPQYPYPGYYHVWASQNSEVDASSIIASGDANIDGSVIGMGPYPNPPEVGSWFSMTFQIGVPCSYSLTGSVASLGASTLPLTVSLSDTNGMLIQSFSSSEYNTFSTNDILDAGEYTVDVSASNPAIWSGNASSSYNLDLVLLPVPEPSTAVLVVMSLVIAALLGNRRLRRSL